MGWIGRQSSHGGAKEKSHLDLPPNEILQILVLSQIHQWRYRNLKERHQLQWVSMRMGEGCFLQQQTFVKQVS
jgi:hypothetical protein